MTDRVLRRLAERRVLSAPVAGEIVLCGGRTVRGLVLDEQPQGLGLVLRGRDANGIREHRECCLGASATFRLLATDTPGRPIPVRLVHVTEAGGNGRRVRAGLWVEFDRLTPREVEHLLEVWHRLEGPGGR